jgi:hypothetical protein
MLGRDGAAGKAPREAGGEWVYPSESAWKFGVDAGAAFLIVALGKRPPMPYVWLRTAWAGVLPRERDGRSDHCVARKNGGSA